MPTLDLNSSVTSGPTTSGPGVTIPVDAIPMPLPIAVGEPGAGGRLRMVGGTEGDDRLELNGGFALGGGGNDTFVLTSTQADADGSEHLGTILDFQAGDKLDLSKLGEKAAELGREADGKGGERVSIDYDGDGKEDGYVVLHANGVPADNDAGVVTPGDGEMHILPYPMPGDGEISLTPPDAGIRFVSDWVI